MPRPTSVTVIGWLYIVFGILMFFGGAFGLAISAAMPDSMELAKARVEAPPPFRTWLRLFDYFGFLAVVQLGAATLMIIGGAAFLKLRPWSRPLLEILAWLGLTYTLAFGAFWIWSVLSISQAAPANAETPPAGFFAIFITVGIVMILTFAVPPAIIIRFLRSNTVRSAFRPASVRRVAAGPRPPNR